MKVYVSEKDIEENELLNVDEYDIVITKYREDFWEEEVYPEIQSLEKHDAEIRKPLEEEIKKIKSTRTPASIPDGVALHYKQENAVIKQAKQEVIDELLGFIKENDYCVGDYSIQNHYAIATDILKQKLNQMKEV